MAKMMKKSAMMKTKSKKKGKDPHSKKGYNATLGKKMKKVKKKSKK